MDEALVELAGAARDLRRHLDEAYEEPIVMHILEARGGHFACGSQRQLPGRRCRQASR